MTLRAWMAKRAPLLREVAIDVIGLVGVAAAVNGVRLMYAPAAWILAGAVLSAWAILKGRAA